MVTRLALAVALLTFPAHANGSMGREVEVIVVHPTAQHRAISEAKRYEKALRAERKAYAKKLAAQRKKRK